METLTITLPAEIKSFLEEQAERGGESVSEYLQAMFREAHERDRHRLEVREKLLEAIAEGPGTPITAADWDDIRREIRARRDLREGGSHAEDAS